MAAVVVVGAVPLSHTPSLVCVGLGGVQLMQIKKGDEERDEGGAREERKRGGKEV
jgi:hypothetical protein